VGGGALDSIDFPVIDFDNHYYEPDDCCSRHIEPKYRDRAIRVVPSAEPGLGKWIMGDQELRIVPYQLSDRSGAPGSKEEMFAGRAQLKPTEVFRPKDVPACMERRARLAVMDDQGLEACVMLPSNAVGFESEFKVDPEGMCANWRSFNRWLEEDWGYGAGGRIFAVPVISLLDAQFAVEETERVAGLGARFVYIRTGPVKGRSPADPAFDPFWRAVEETGVTVIFHLDTSDYNETIATQWSEDPRRTGFELSPLQVFHSYIDRPIRDTLAALVLHNLFGRFPKVQVISIELGAFWLRPLLRDMDKAAMFGASGRLLGGKLDGLPSEILAKHLRVVPYYEDDIEDLLEVIDIRRILFGSDFPHAEGLKEPLQFLKYLPDLPDRDVRRIMRDNAAEVLGLDPLAAT
jgi:predicted TIM-barrel fold metal-dependent hydrolase